MIDCQGREPLSTKVDSPTIEKIDEVAEERDISRSEAIRRVIGTFLESDQGELSCPCCGEELVFDI